MSEQGLVNTRELGPGAIRSRHVILALLTALNLLNYVDRYVMSAVLAKVQDDLQLSNFVGGSLATVFLIGYFATSPIFGTLADRSRQGGRKRLMTLGVAVWSVATVASGLANGALSLLAARAVVGVGEASYATIAPTIIDDVAKPAQKGRWMAIFSTAIPVGSALGYIVGGTVLQAHGWRSAFFVAGGPGLLVALLCLLIAEPLRRTGAAPEVLGAARTLLRLPKYRAAVAGYCAYTFAIGGFAFWAPKYLNARYGMEAGRASVNFGLITVVAGLAGTLAGGWLADVASRRRTRARVGENVPATTESDTTIAGATLSVCALSAGLGAVLSAAAIAAPTPQGFFLLLAPCEVALFLSTGPVNVALLRTVPTELRASAMALGIFAIHLLGDLWSPILIGLAADHVPMAWAMMAAPIFFAFAAFVWHKSGRLGSRRG